MNDYTILKNLNDLDAESKALLEKAKQALPNAYAPYSNFHVAAAILLSDGSVVTGTNQDFTSWKRNSLRYSRGSEQSREH